MRPELSLVYDPFLDRVNELDGIFDRQDVHGPRGIYVVYHGGQSSRFSLTGRARNEDHPLMIIATTP